MKQNGRIAFVVYNTLLNNYVKKQNDLRYVFDVLCTCALPFFLETCYYAPKFEEVVGAY